MKTLILSKQKKIEEGEKRMIKEKKNSGITLIALIITVIVMLILAGVSLNALVGDNRSNH